ncbi:Rrf2 family transcriptional regulator [Novosphingobium sp. LASN5T]|uniref:RrF2 family transcriptional regulator n=1 Tax=Novosphingobium sp. LASN5T TaxID=2491021 RepID=UPI000F5E8D33|nr:Rrf2 family transcriptional regulator [Novosphingobium sp. LASN5T]RQW46106.1 Rrf2 family transcriptional regulator [Novosphingobium sp. LASN5T]
MAHLTSSVEYGIHCLLWLVRNDGQPASSRDLAELQGVSTSFVAKIFPKLEKAGIVRASEGVRGGYLLAWPADEISFLDIVDAIEGKKPLFDCQEIRSRCALFDGQPPAWASAGTCAIHAVMLQAEQAMRETLASQSLGSVSQRFVRKAPESFLGEVAGWLGERISGRGGKGRKRTPKV